MNKERSSALSRSPHPVSTLVNKPANDGPRCVEPVVAA